MKNISFSLTTEQFLNGTKTVTRRWGWKNLKPGTELRAVKRSMGLRRGEHPEVLGTIRVISVRRERLDDITLDDVRREGFPEMKHPMEFVLFFLGERPGGYTGASLVTVITFERIDKP